MYTQGGTCKSLGGGAHRLECKEKTDDIKLTVKPDVIIIHKSNRSTEYIHMFNLHYLCTQFQK